MALTFEELAERLAKAQEAIPGWIKMKGAELAAQAEMLAKLNATVRPRVRSGRLRNSIRGTTSVRDGNFEVRLSAGGGVPGALDVHYAIVQERGYRGMVTVRTFTLASLGRTRAGVSRDPTERSGTTGATFQRRMNVPATWFARRAMDQVRKGAPEALRPLLTEVLGVS